MDRMTLAGILGKYAIIVEAADDGTFWVTTSNTQVTGKNAEHVKQIFSGSFDRWLNEPPVEKNEGALTDTEVKELLETPFQKEDKK